MKLSKKKLEKHIDTLYRKHCSGIAVPIMKLGDIFDAGEKALLAGGTDEQVGEALRQAALSAAVG